MALALALAEALLTYLLVPGVTSTLVCVSSSPLSRVSIPAHHPLACRGRTRLDMLPAFQQKASKPGFGSQL